MNMHLQATQSDLSGIAPQRFEAEVEAFRATIADPTISFVDKRLAYVKIVGHAGLLNQDDAGFWRAGVALKDALETWLDFHPTTGH
jgi:hypothetical protein